MFVRGPKFAERYNLLAILGALRSLQLMPTPTTSERLSPPSGASVAELFRRVSPHVAALDAFMRQQVDQFEPEIRTMAAYCLDTTGKRLRPTMVFIAGWKGEGVVDENLVRAAGVVEMVHLATLVHDDIMDRAELRRSRRTVAREYGADAAVLLGDALFAQALHIASQFPTTEVCRRISESTRKVCSGEIMQTLRRRDFDISLEDYWRMIDLKTAELFRVSCFLGASLAGYDAAFARAADGFGHHLGIAYQIYDDLVDFLGDEKDIGKTLGTDLATGKLTLPLMLLLQKVSLAERATIVSALQEGRSPGLATSGARMTELGIAADVVQAIDSELARADTILASYTSLPPVAFLKQLAVMLKAQVTALSERRGSA